jgi:hypothetical protein
MRCSPCGVAVSRRHGMDAPAPFHERRPPRWSTPHGPSRIAPPRLLIAPGRFGSGPGLDERRSPKRMLYSIAPGDGVRADERIRTADPSITRAPRRLRLVAVCGAECLGQAILRPFGPPALCGWCGVVCCHPVATSGRWLDRGRTLTRLATWHRQPRRGHEITPRPGSVPIHGAVRFVDGDLPIHCTLKFDGVVLGYPKRLAARINTRGPVSDAGARVMAEYLADRPPAR